jgi:hypothetical protein
VKHVSCGQGDVQLISHVGLCVYCQEHGFLKDVLSEAGATSTSEENTRTTGPHAESGMQSPCTGIPRSNLWGGPLIFLEDVFQTGDFSQRHFSIRVTIKINEVLVNRDVCEEFWGGEPMGGRVDVILDPPPKGVLPAGVTP